MPTLLWPDTIAIEPRFTMRWTVQLQRSMRRAVHIRKSGLFFVCFDRAQAADVTTKELKEPTELPAVPETPLAANRTANEVPTHYAWVQAACSGREAGRFKFTCELIYGQQTVATYEDAVFGDSWSPSAIQSAPYCLAVCIPANLTKAWLRVTICEYASDRPARTTSAASTKLRRSKITKVVEQSPQPSSNAAASADATSAVRRNRRRIMPTPSES